MTDTSAEDDKTATILAERADALISDLGLDVSDAEQESRGSATFRKVADAYERLARARQLRGMEPSWQNSDGEYLMDRLWKMREKLDEE